MIAGMLGSTEHFLLVLWKGERGYLIVVAKWSDGDTTSVLQILGSVVRFCALTCTARLAAHRSCTQVLLDSQLNLDHVPICCTLRVSPHTRYSCRSTALRDATHNLTSHIVI
jgi:hypothetical protein